MSAVLAPRAAVADDLSLAAWRRIAPEILVGVAGGTWRYRESTQPAAGPALLLLPGAQGTGDIFYKTALLLRAQGVRVITVTPPAWSDCERIAAGLGALLDALGLEQVHLLGSSLSGYTVQWFAQLHPQRIATLFLSNTFHDASPYQAQMPSVEQIAATPAQALLDGMVGRMLAAPATTPEERELADAVRALMGSAQTADDLKTRVLALRRARPVPPVPLPAQRIVLIDDDADPVILPAMREALRQRYAASETHAIPGGGHYPAILRAEQYAAILLRRVRAEGAVA